MLGDLEEAHRRRLRRHGPARRALLTALETLDMAAALVRVRVARLATNKGSSIVQDYKLGLRMLVKYPGLTLAGGLALAIAIGIGAGWYDLTGDLSCARRLPLPDGDRIVEIEMRNRAGGGDERRLLHDFSAGSAMSDRSTISACIARVERNLILGDARPEPVTIAETTASAFRLARVPPLLGRPLLDADEQPGAPPVVVLGYACGSSSSADATTSIGQTVQLGKTTTTVVGVMPEGFAFPINHRLWVPLQLRPVGLCAARRSGDARLRPAGAGRDPGAGQCGAHALTRTHGGRLAADARASASAVLAYGGESPGDRTWLEFVITHLPILLVLVVACINVGTLIYARTATREAEIATRYALGASRARIVTQLFVEALVLASIAAVVGLLVANWALNGACAFYSGQTGGAAVLGQSGLKPTTILYAAVLTIVGAAILGVLPALKVTRRTCTPQLRNLGAGGSTLRFGWFWTTAMIVAGRPDGHLYAAGVWVSRKRRSAIDGSASEFPAEHYLAIESSSIATRRLRARSRRGVRGTARADLRRARTARSRRNRMSSAVTFADRLPGMGVAVRTRRSRVAAARRRRSIPNLWTATRRPEILRDVRHSARRGPRFPRRRSRCRRACRARQRSVRAPLHERRESGRPARALCQPAIRRRAAAVVRDRRHGPRHRHDAHRSRRGAVRVHAGIAGRDRSAGDRRAGRRRSGRARAAPAGDRGRPRSRPAAGRHALAR